MNEAHMCKHLYTNQLNMSTKGLTSCQVVVYKKCRCNKNLVRKLVKGNSTKHKMKTNE